LGSDEDEEKEEEEVWDEAHFDGVEVVEYIKEFGEKGDDGSITLYTFFAVSWVAIST
jgi:hypothetical protein